MKSRLSLKKFAVSCIAGAVILTSGSLVCSAASASPSLPQAGATLENVVSEGSLPSAGLALDLNTYTAIVTSEKQETEKKAEPVQEAQTAEAVETEESVDAAPAVTEKSEYDDIAIAQVDGYVNVRQNPDTDSEIIGKLYDNSAATVVGTDGEWFEITSGAVHGYIKQQFVVVGDEELAKAVGHRVAVVQAETLRVREKESVESNIIGLVPVQEVLEVVSEGEGWVQVAVEEGDGYVSNDYVTCETRYTVAESKEEEEARIAAEEEAQKNAEAEETTENSSKKSGKKASTKATEETATADADDSTSTDESYVYSDEGASDSASATVDEGTSDSASAAVDEGTSDSASAAVDEGTSDSASASADAGTSDTATASADQGTSDSASVSADTGSTGGGSVASFACQFVGNPYVWGGTSLTNGADCSGFVMSVYANFGVSLPHSSGAIAGCGVPVTDGNYQPGDVICYNGHVGIYIGNGQMVHASNSTNGIIISNYNYRSDIVSVRRFL